LRGDIITAINEHRITGMEQLVKQINGMHVGDTLSLHIMRDGRHQEIRVLLTERP
jgi:S1-C subfamily serine protease